MMGEQTNEELHTEYERLAKLMLDKMSALKIIPEEDLAVSLAPDKFGVLF